jgi:hypothetical protein
MNERRFNHWELYSTIDLLVYSGNNVFFFVAPKYRSRTKDPENRFALRKQFNSQRLSKNLVSYQILYLVVGTSESLIRLFVNLRQRATGPTIALIV